MKLNLGSGEFRLEGCINIDIRDLPEVDLVYDLNQGLPFGDGIVDSVVASHVLEHLANPHFILSEICRVCKSDATVEIRVPLYQVWQEDHLTCFYPEWFIRNCPDWEIVDTVLETVPNIRGDEYQQMTVFMGPRL